MNGRQQYWKQWCVTKCRSLVGACFFQLLCPAYGNAHSLSYTPTHRSSQPAFSSQAVLASSRPQVIYGIAEHTIINICVLYSKVAILVFAVSDQDNVKDCREKDWMALNESLHLLDLAMARLCR